MIDYKSFTAYPWKDKSFYARISASAIAMVVLIFAAGSLTGMFLAPTASDTACEQSLGVYNQSNLGLQAALSTCLENNKALDQKADSCMVNLTRSNNQLSACNSVLNLSNTDNAQLTSSVANLTTKADTLSSNLHNLSTNYSVLAANAAYKICCQLVHLGYNFSNYRVENNQIYCDATSGTPISC